VPPVIAAGLGLILTELARPIEQLRGIDLLFFVSALLLGEGMSSCGAKMKPIDVLIITALTDEYNAVLNTDEGARSVWEAHKTSKGYPFDIRVYQSNKGYPLKVALVGLAGMGAIHARAMVDLLLIELKPRCVASCGLCAGRRGAVSLGDLIVAKRIHSDENFGRKLVNDFGIRVTTNLLSPRWEAAVDRWARKFGPDLSKDRPLTLESQELWLLQVLARDIDPLAHADRKQYCPDWSTVLTRLQQNGFLSRRGLKLTKEGRGYLNDKKILHPDGFPDGPTFDVHIGSIVSTNRVIAGASFFENLVRYTPYLLGLDIESGTIAEAAEHEGVEQVLVVKGVSDFADLEKDDRYRAFSAKTSARFLLGLIRHELEQGSKNLSDDERRYVHGSANAGINGGSYSLTRVSLEKVQGFQKLDLNLSHHGQPVNTVIMLGDNSAGKTSILRAISLGIADIRDTTIFLEFYRGNFIRQEASKATITVELKGENGTRLKIETIVYRHKETLGRRYLDITDPLTPVQLDYDQVPWKGIFIVGYGPARHAGQINRMVESYRIRDGVANLFDQNRALQYPELSLRRAITSLEQEEKEHSGKILARFENLISGLLPLGTDSKIALTERGIEVVDGKRSVPLMAQGEGFQSTLAWVLDLIAQKMLSGEIVAPEDLTAMVLIDEIEQHLHPKWQLEIVQKLRNMFPKVQWLLTTHSPLCTAGLADLPDEQTCLFKLVKDDTGEIVCDELASLRGLKTHQILRSEAFGLPSTYPPGMAEKLARFASIFLNDKRTPAQQEEFEKLKSYLEDNLGEPAEDNENRLLQKQLKKRLADLDKLYPMEHVEAEPDS